MVIVHNISHICCQSNMFLSAKDFRGKKHIYMNWLIINNFLVGSCSCYSTFFSSYYYFPSYTSNPYYRKTEIDMKKWFSQTGWNCLPAILSTVFMTGFHLVFMISTKRWFFDCVTFPENWLNRFSWKFFSACDNLFVISTNSKRCAVATASCPSFIIPPVRHKATGSRKVEAAISGVQLT